MHPASRDQPLAAVRAFHAEHGRLPRWREWERATGSRPCARTVERRWGWRELLAEAIGVRPNQVEVSWVPVLDDRASDDAGRTSGCSRRARALADERGVGSERTAAVLEDVRAALRRVGGGEVGRGGQRLALCHDSSARSRRQTDATIFSMMRGVHEMGRVELPAAGARALAWVGGQLFDIAAGWTHYPLDGSAVTRRYSGYGPGFDAACVAPNGDVVALVQSTGTKGLLLDADTGLLREVDRSYYCAEAYRYPIALFTLPSGRTGIVHCPKEYNRLEIEDARTGDLMTGGVPRDPQDCFHSRLAVSSSGRYLLSAGWMWQPWGCLVVYDLRQALSDPRVLDPVRSGVFDMIGLVGAEISGACFSADDVVMSTSPEPNEPDSPDDLEPNMLARWSTRERRFLWRRHLRETAGDLLTVGDGVLALHRHPRLYDAATGELVAEWPDLDTGRADSSIVWEHAFSGTARVAVDVPNRRFAVADGERIVVINMDREA